ncbi:MAG: YggT family protein [Bacillota bacterium]|nr:YggT family protein [Bacillota bacterium]
MILIVIRTVHTMFRVLILSLFVRAIMSWFVRDYSHPVPNFIYRFTEPLLMPMRKLFDRLGINQSMIDFSFIATFIALQILDTVIVRLLVRLFY